MSTDSREKISVFIDHDIIFRNFIFTPAFKDLESKFDVEYVFQKNNKRFTLNPERYLNKNKIKRVKEISQEKVLEIFIILECNETIIRPKIKKFKKF